MFSTHPLVDAVRFKNLPKIDSIIKSNPQIINTFDQKGHTALHIACYLNSTNIVSLLLRNGADPLLTNPKTFSRNALHFACSSGAFEVALLLIKKKIYHDLNQYDDRGYSPLHHAINKKNLFLVELLVQNGSKINISNSKQVSRN
ncbi:cyclin-dependent kinase inhibitor 2c-related [Anaeramoeba flamelloides]|uniref:Cyclin-dependent kinase inhibitor 2c-related n=1 Tax=Anaeramoeba flamelloides TaxID=1746091 RepID=A0AAV7ZEM4_9EUKA|nr:cyclin-dependent kinase inhibitor 2c-related [Anaeramoeba flamelloides]KAJ6235534.1 cyclin-dependent kinase inhibitor 2c-related [Anaeramoeba flamelloides]